MIFTLADALLCAPGQLHEVETIYLNGRMQKVYKHLWPSVREFWLSRVEKYSKNTYIIFEDQRDTYGEVHHRAVRVAAVFRHVYGVGKGGHNSSAKMLLSCIDEYTGDRVGICSRNCFDYLVSFWAARTPVLLFIPVASPSLNFEDLLGAVPVLINA